MAESRLGCLTPVRLPLASRGAERLLAGWQKLLQLIAINACVGVKAETRTL